MNQPCYQSYYRQLPKLKYYHLNEEVSTSMVKLFKNPFKSEESGLADKGITIVERVGQGTYSTVYRATRKNDDVSI